MPRKTLDFSSPTIAGDECTALPINGKAELEQRLRAAARSHIYDAGNRASGATAVYTLADPRELRGARYVGQTRDPRRRFAEHLRTARLWLPHEIPWWVRSPEYRPLYTWIRALYRDEGRLPCMWVAEWVAPGGDALAAERATIVRLLTAGARLLNVEARRNGAQLPLL
jgi:hypothetical protein